MSLTPGGALASSEPSERSPETADHGSSGTIPSANEESRGHEKRARHASARAGHGGGSRSTPEWVFPRHAQCARVARPVPLRVDLRVDTYSRFFFSFLYRKCQQKVSTKGRTVI